LRNGFSIFCHVDAAYRVRAIKEVLKAMELRAGGPKLSWRRAARAIRGALLRR
jgi:hypothetical protein